MMKEIEAAGPDATIDQILINSYRYAEKYSYTHPCQYGYTELRDFTLREYFMNGGNNNNGNKARSDSSFFYDETACASYDVPYQTARRRYENTRAKEDYIELQRQVEIRKRIDKVIYKIVDAALPANDDVREYIEMPVCKVCNASCPCIARCKELSRPSKNCTLHCCSEPDCYAKPDSPDYVCQATLSTTFDKACGHINNSYMQIAYEYFGRLCRYPHASVEAAVDAIKKVCAAY